MKRICPFCGDTLPPNAHMNAVYCSTECYNEAKCLRQKNKRIYEAEIRRHKKATAAKLESLWLRFGNGVEFNPMYADAEEFDFSIADGFTRIDNDNAAVVLGFAYKVISPEKMKIWKL